MASVTTNDALLIAMNRMYKSSPDYTEPSVFKVGTTQTTAQVTDQDLDHPVPISGTEQIDDCDATTGWTDSADMTISVNSTTFKQGSGSLNLTKDGTASANASTSKTTTNRDFTSKDFSIWLYVLDQTTLDLFATTNCITLRFGSDASNYYQWTKNKADLAVGWNLIDQLTSANATPTGSPTITACDYTFVQITSVNAADTWSAGAVIMDDIKLASSDDYTKTFTSGYPIIDEDTKDVTVRCDLSSVEANGYLLSGFGMFNTDSTAKMEGIDDFSVESKTDTDEIIFTIKNNFTLV